MPAVEPVAALRRIAYLLEAEQAETYRVRAFRRAAEAARQVGPERLRSLAESSRLRELQGVGEVSAGVIQQAVEGRIPDYLAQLERRAAPPPQGDAGELRRALRGDLHVHSDWSDGGSPIEEMAEAAIGLGHQYIALTDHSPRLTVARGLSVERLGRQLEAVSALNRSLAPFRILTGIEVDILEDGELDQEPGLLSRLDLVVASIHSKLRMPGREMTERMVRAVSNPNTDVLGHCTGRLLTGRSRPQSEFDPEAVFDACARHGTAVEINSRPERLDPPVSLLQRALGSGCLFAIDTDAHAPGQMEWLRLGCERALRAGVAGRIVNTMEPEALLRWTAGRRAQFSPES